MIDITSINELIMNAVVGGLSAGSLIGGVFALIRKIG